MIIGGAFMLFGISLYVWNRRENLAYRDRLMRRPDMREFMTGWPPRWWLKTLQLGGTIALVVGLALLVMGIVFHTSGG